MKPIAQLRARRKPCGPITLPSVARLIVRSDGSAIVAAAGGWRQPTPIDLALATKPFLQITGWRG